MNSHLTRSAAIAAVVLAAPLTLAQLTYDEGVNGDLSGDGLAPDALAFGAGTNTISGTFGIDFSDPDSEQDIDYFTFTVDAGFQLTAISLLSYSGDDGVAFIGIQNGSQFTEGPLGADAANLLGYTLYGTGQQDAGVGTNLLPLIGQGFGSQGFAGPLGPGDYSIWLNQTGALTTHALGFVIEPIPAPASAALLGLGGAIAARRRR